MVNNSVRFRQLAILESIKDHAAKNYNRGGWDILVECYSDEEIIALIGQATTATGAIKKIGRHLKVLDDNRKDIESTAF